MSLLHWIARSGLAHRIGLSHAEALIIITSQIAVAASSLLLALVLFRVAVTYWNDPSMRYLRLFKASLVVLFLVKAAEATLGAYSFKVPLWNALCIAISAKALVLSFLVVAAVPQLRQQFWERVRGLVEERAAQQVNEIVAATRRLNDMQHTIRDRTATLERIVKELDNLRPLGQALKGGACPLVPAAVTAREAAEKAAAAMQEHDELAGRLLKVVIPPEGGDPKGGGPTGGVQ